MFVNKIIGLPKIVKQLLLFSTDAFILIFSIWLAFSIRLDEMYWPPGGLTNPIILLASFAPVIALPIFIKFGLYRAIIRYLGMRAVWSVARAVSLYGILWAVFVLLSGVEGIPRSVIIINLLVALIGVGGSRMVARWLLRLGEGAYKAKQTSMHPKWLRRNVLIYGAGNAGRQLAMGLNQSNSFKLIGFVDDSHSLQGRDLLSLPIVSPDTLPDFVTNKGVDDILLAIPSVSHKQRSVIIDRLRSLKVRVRTLPGLMDMAQGKVDYSKLLDLDINDLLAREPAICNEDLMQKHINNQVVMVTGAGGSIGSELCRQILIRKPKVLLLFELNEFALFTINDELTKLSNQFAIQLSEQHSGTSIAPQVVPLLGSINDPLRLNEIISTWHPTIIYHAAALKHVPLVEQNVVEGIKTNVFGTLELAKAAIENQVSRFVLISTDKAVNPTNVMGASKRCSELLLQALAAENKPELVLFNGNESVKTKVKRVTQFSMVRFGNVLGSSGSVVPYFREQIKCGGPVTLTHPDITRYFMTIPEAAQLVIQVGAMSKKEKSFPENDKHAEVYVLDMGEPVKILDLATRMIELSGYQVRDAQNPDGDIAIDIVGLRPGEKLYEELLIGNNPLTTEHPRIIKAQESYLVWKDLQQKITYLRNALDIRDIVLIRSILQQLVPEYQLQEKIVDFIYVNKN